jgi:hypothetical protein
MPQDSLSERDRLRLAELMRAPLFPQPAPAKPSTNRPRVPWTESSWITARNKIDSWWKSFGDSTWQPHLAMHRRQWLVGGALSVGCLVVLAVTLMVANRRDAGSIQLQAQDSRGQLHIRWDTDSDLIRRATGAKLYITDGAERIFVNLDGMRLRRGAVTYPRQTDRVEFRLAVTEPDGRLIEQQAIFFQAPAPSVKQNQLEASVRPAAPPVQAPAEAEADEPLKPANVTGHRSRTKPLVQSGTRLPFTCAAGDVFRKTDAAPGWDTFTCRGKNVWSISGTQRDGERSTGRPSTKTTTLIARPATTSTT